MKELKCGPGWVQCGCGRGTPYSSDQRETRPYFGRGPYLYDVVGCSCGTFLVFLGEFEDGSTQGHPNKKGWMWAVATLPDDVAKAYKRWREHDLVINWGTHALAERGHFMCRRCHQEEKLPTDNQVYPGAQRRCRCGHAAVYVGIYVGPDHPDTKRCDGWLWKDDLSRPFEPPTVVVRSKTTKYFTAALKTDKELRAAATDHAGNIVAREGPENWLHFASRDAAKEFLEQCRSSVGRKDFNSWVIIRHVSPEKVVPEDSK